MFKNKILEQNMFKENILKRAYVQEQNTWTEYV